MTFKDIVTKRTFTGKDGQEKTTWLKVGTLKEMEHGRQFIELNMFPETSFYVFEQKEFTKKPVQNQVEGIKTAIETANQIDWDE